MRTSIHELEAWGDSSLEGGWDAEGWDADGWDDQSWAEAYDEEDAAESFSLGRALRELERGAGQVLSNPAVAQLASTVLPTGAGALGTLIGGPVGAAVGQRLGTYAAGALAPGPKPAGASVGVVPPALSSPTIPTGASSAPLPVGGATLASVAPGLTSQQQAALGTLLAQVAAAAQPVPPTGGATASGSVSSLLAGLSQVFGRAAAEAEADTPFADDVSWVSESNWGAPDSEDLGASWDDAEPFDGECSACSGESAELGCPGFPNVGPIR
jgi:hypothetical protein